MLSESQASFLIRRLFTQYVRVWHVQRWHDLSPLAVLYCRRLRDITARKLVALPGVKPLAGRQPELDDRTLEEAGQFVIGQFARYLQFVARDRERSCPRPSVRDVERSRLLRWLLQGRAPLPLPPPYLYARGWHQLATGEASLEVEFFEKSQVRGERNFLAGRVVVGANGWDFAWRDRRLGLVDHLPTGHVYSLREGRLQRFCRRMAA